MYSLQVVETKGILEQAKQFDVEVKKQVILPIPKRELAISGQGREIEERQDEGTEKKLCITITRNQSRLG